VDIGQILTYGDSFSVSLAEVNDAACSELVIQMAKQVESAAINNVTVKPVNGQLNLALTYNTCLAGDVNSLLFVFQ
jgi:hypothetical protein